MFLENLVFVLLVATIAYQARSRFRMLLVDSTSSGAEGVPDAPGIAVQNPEVEGDERPKWKGKGKAIVLKIDAESIPNCLDDDEKPVDWTQYDPPEGLRDPAGCTTDIVIQVIQESIDKVKTRIIQEADRREAEEEVKKLRQEERIRQENEDAKYAETLNSSLDETRLDASTEATSPDRPAKSKKRRLMNLLRRLKNVEEKGESSAAGAARHKRDVSWTSIEQSTQAAGRRIVTEVLKRTTTNSSGSPSAHDTEVECVSCLDDFNPKEMIKAPCHSYCKPCFLRLISTACQNEQQWPPKCCLNPIPYKTINSNINDELRKTYRDRAAEWGTPVSEQAQDEAELQEALRLIEEFEREEALKAELLQRERERIAEERRAKKIEERIKLEGERRRILGIKFQELREVFANLHDIQRVAVLQKHDEEQADLKNKGAASLVEFQTSWDEDHEKLVATANAKISEKEEELKREYAARVIAERRVEEKYESELKAYWSRSRKEDREERSEAAMKEFKRKMDDKFKSWEKWRDNELEAFRWAAKEELAIQEEHKEVEERRLLDNTQATQTQFLRRKTAELRWVDVVIEERDRMLNDMEVDEIEHGEDVDAWFEDDGLDDIDIEDIDIEIPEEMLRQHSQTPMLGMFPSLIWSNSGHS
ncbi:hypothetical protein ABKA04_006522 [Annulohypoxylon sp. FPYF3050]